MYDELVERLRDCRNMAVLSEFWWDITTEAADAIIELKKKVVEWQEDACVWNNKYYLLLDNMPRWISVEERLPGEYVSLLVCFDFKGKKSVDVAELWSDGKFHNFSDEHLTPEGRKYRRATHWMPLPSTEGLNET